MKSDPRIRDAMRLGIVNNRRLAQHIQRDVSRAVGYNAGVGTIAVTLHRLGAEMKAGDERKYTSILGRSRLQLRDGISILYMKGDPEFTEPKPESRGFYVRIMGIGTTTVFTDDDGLETIGYKREYLLKKISDLSAIIITSPREIVETPGVIAQLMMSLGGGGINVIEVTSSYDNTFLIVDRKDSLKAVEVVRSLIAKSRR